MKVKALASISGRPGRRAVGDQFIVDAEYGAYLVERGLVKEVPETAPEPEPEQPAKTPSKPRMSKT